MVISFSLSLSLNFFFDFFAQSFAALNGMPYHCLDHCMCHKINKSVFICASITMRKVRHDPVRGGIFWKIHFYDMTAIRLLLFLSNYLSSKQALSDTTKKWMVKSGEYVAARMFQLHFPRIKKKTEHLQIPRKLVVFSHCKYECIQPKFCAGCSHLRASRCDIE